MVAKETTSTEKAAKKKASESAHDEAAVEEKGKTTRRRASSKASVGEEGLRRQDHQACHGPEEEGCRRERVNAGKEDSCGFEDRREEGHFQVRGDRRRGP